MFFYYFRDSWQNRYRSVIWWILGGAAFMNRNDSCHWIIQFVSMVKSILMPKQYIQIHNFSAGMLLRYCDTVGFTLCLSCTHFYYYSYWLLYVWRVLFTIWWRNLVSKNAALKIVNFDFIPFSVVWAFSAASYLGPCCLSMTHVYDVRH